MGVCIHMIIPLYHLLCSCMPCVKQQAAKQKHICKINRFPLLMSPSNFLDLPRFFLLHAVFKGAMEKQEPTHYLFGAARCTA